MAQINLAPGTQFIAAARRRRRALYASGTLLLILIGVIWGGLFVWVQGAEEELQAEAVALQKLEAEITRAGDTVDRIESFESRLLALNRLLDDHIDWAPVFVEIQRLLPETTRIRSLDFQHEQNKITIEGRAPTVDHVAQTLASLRDTPARETLFKDIEVGILRRTSVVGEAGEEIGAEYEFQAKFLIK